MFVLSCRARETDSEPLAALQRVQVAAENAEADYELAAKHAGGSVQDPSAKPGYGGSGSGAGGAAPEGDDSMLVVATAVDSVEADILPSKHLICVARSVRHCNTAASLSSASLI